MKISVRNWIPMLLFSILCGFGVRAQKTTIPCNPQQIAKWYKKGDWLNGLKLKPHKSIDRAELARQFCSNPQWWEQAFEFLAAHDLDALEPGRYVINEGNVMAFVIEGPTVDQEEIEWETHRNFNDLQYVVRGKAGMGVASLNHSRFHSKAKYDNKRDVEHYRVENGRFYVAKPGSFFIFSPLDIHRPAFRKKGNDTIKKILIKVRVP